MKILLVKLTPIESIDSGTIRTLGLVKGLTELNNVVDYLSIPLSNTHVKRRDSPLFDKINIIITNNNLNYDRVIGSNGKLKKIIIGFVRRIYHILNMYDYTYSIAKKIDISLLSDMEYDLIISSSDPKTSHIAVENLIKQGLKYKKWIQYWGDPMAIDITKKSIYPQWIIKKMEKKILMLADEIVYVSPFTLMEQKKLYPDIADKMNFLPIPYIEEKIYEYTNNDKFTIGYFGSYYSEIRNIIPLYNSADKLKDKVNLNIVGDSDKQVKSTENIGIYPRGDISEFEKKADLLVCVLNSKGTQIPGKMYHYAATNKPILVILDGQDKDGMRDYLESFNRFIICDNNENSIISTIKNIIEGNQIFSPSKQFAAKTIASHFLELV